MIHRRFGGRVVGAAEETINAMLDRNGQLHLSHRPQLPPGPVRVTIRSAIATGSPRGLADVVREIATEQRSRGFPGRPAAEIDADENAQLADDTERDAEQEGARRTTPGGP
jgi:hypothetical protein